jgi:hypothetical protein
MSNNETRLAATFLIWAGCVAIAIFGRSPNISEGNAVAFMFVLALAGSISTIAVWASTSGHASNDAKEMAEKAKRRGKVERMLDQLSDQDIAELRTRLMEQEADAVPLEDLMKKR